MNRARAGLLWLVRYFSGAALSLSLWFECIEVTLAPAQSRAPSEPPPRTHDFYRNGILVARYPDDTLGRLNAADFFLRRCCRESEHIPEACA